MKAVITSVWGTPQSVTLAQDEAQIEAIIREKGGENLYAGRTFRIMDVESRPCWYVDWTIYEGDIQLDATRRVGTYGTREAALDYVYDLARHLKDGYVQAGNEVVVDHGLQDWVFTLTEGVK